MRERKKEENYNRTIDFNVRISFLYFLIAPRIIPTQKMIRNVVIKKENGFSRMKFEKQERKNGNTKLRKKKNKKK